MNPPAAPRPPARSPRRRGASYALRPADGPTWREVARIRGAVVREAVAVGRLEPIFEIPVTPTNGGVVTRIFVVQGQRVAQGDPLAGVGDVFGEMRRHGARPGGRFLNPRDLAQRRRVCFLGDRVARKLFGEEEPVGRTLELDGTPLTVVGVGPPRITHTNYNGEGRDKVTVPATTFVDLTGWSRISHVWVALEPGSESGAVLATVRRALGARLRFDPTDEAARDVTDYTEAIVVTALGGLAGLVACALLLAGLGRIELPPEVLAYLGRPRLDPVSAASCSPCSSSPARSRPGSPRGAP